MVSILDILSGAVPLMVDVRQTGGSPLCVTKAVRGESGPVARRLYGFVEVENSNFLAFVTESRSDCPSERRFARGDGTDDYDQARHTAIIAASVIGNGLMI
jgi:hypothetical protein